MTLETEQQAEEEQQGLHVISSGSGELDKKMGGGVPLSSLTLIEGTSGAGKSTLTQHLMWGAVTMGGTAAVYTTENTVKSLLRQMESLGMDVSDYFLLDALRVYPLEAKAKDDPEVAYQGLSNHIQALNKHDVIVLDSLSTFLTKSTAEQILTFFSRCKDMCDEGKTIICTAHSHAFDEMILTRVRSVCDAHLKLLVEPGASELVKTMEIAKVKGAELSTGSIISYSIEPGIGMRIIPVSKARA